MSSPWVSLPAFAKINLNLELVGRRADGYWEIRTRYQTVSLHDRLRLRLTRPSRARRAGVEVRVPGGGAPAGRANLVYRILARACRRLGLRCGVEVEIEKNIPVARGLGGGSSDAASALLGLLRLTGERLADGELVRLGAAVGADVPFFFVGGQAWGVGRGDDVHPLDDSEPAYCLLVCPPRRLPTRAAYAWARRAGLTRRRRPAIIADSPDGLWGTGNDFEPVIFSRFPELARMKAALLGAGARQAGLSGSGSTVYALFTHRAAAERASRLAGWARAASVFLAETLSRARYRRALGWGVVQR